MMKRITHVLSIILLTMFVINSTCLCKALEVENFETERLIASITTDADIENLSTYLLDKNVTNYLDPTLKNGFNNKDEAIEFLKELKKLSYSFTIKLKDSQLPIGQVNYMVDSESSTLMLSYWLASEYQQKGYASEIILPLTKEMFESCEDINILYISCDKENISSFKLAERICNFVNQDEIYDILINKDCYASGEVNGDTIEFYYSEFQVIIK